MGRSKVSKCRRFIYCGRKEASCTRWSPNIARTGNRYRVACGGQEPRTEKAPSNSRTGTDQEGSRHDQLATRNRHFSGKEENNSKWKILLVPGSNEPARPPRMRFQSNCIIAKKSPGGNRPPGDGKHQISFSMIRSTRCESAAVRAQPSFAPQKFATSCDSRA